MGFTYLGPVDGHNVHALIRLLDEAKALKKPVLVHAITQKGRGYAFSEENPEKFHGISPFQVSTGEVPAARKLNCSGVFGQAILELGGQDPKIVAVTAAMPAGTGLKPFAKAYPQRFFDVGIAEEHAVTMAAGMACQGMKPVVALYSSFLQRSVDTILHDVCLQKLPVVLAVDRAGLVGEDGETHQGLFDPAFLCPMPHMSVYAPATLSEIPAMLRMALQRGEPAALRYNRGTLPRGIRSATWSTESGRYSGRLRQLPLSPPGSWCRCAAERWKGWDAGWFRLGSISRWTKKCFACWIHPGSNYWWWKRMPRHWDRLWPLFAGRPR